MSERVGNRRGWTVAIFLFVAVEATGFQLRGALLPSLRDAFAVSEALLGLVATAGTGGFVVSLLLVGLAAGYIDVRRALLLGIAGMTAAVLLMAGSLTYPMYLAALLLRGVATGPFRALDRAVLGHLYPDARGRMFNLYGLVWAVGAAAGPMVVTAALALGSWRLAYLALAVGFLPALVLVARLDLSLSGAEEGLELSDLRAVLRRPPVAGMVGGLVLSGGVEGTVFTWLPYYAATSFEPAAANAVLSAFLLAYVPGRLVHSVAVERVGPLRYVVLAAAAGIPLSALAFVVASGPALFPAVFAFGLVQSAVFPTLSAFGVDAAPAFSGPVNALATSAAYTGIAVVPAVLGVVVSAAGIGAAMTAIVPLLGAFLLVVLATARVEGERFYPIPR